MCLSFFSHAQSELYNGGNADGFDSIATGLIVGFPTFTELYGGGDADGFDTVATGLIVGFPTFTELYGDGDADGFDTVATGLITGFPTFTELYGGGDADGFDTVATGLIVGFPTFLELYGGGNADGFDTTATGLIVGFPTFSELYDGGNADGFDTMATGLIVSFPTFSELYGGGNADGFDTTTTGLIVSFSTFTELYGGGDADGFDTVATGLIVGFPTFSELYVGGNADGFDKINLYFESCVYLGETNTIPNPVSSGLYKSFEPIVFAGTIENDSNVTFKSGQSITLLAGFHAGGTGKFRAVIDQAASLEVITKDESCIGNDGNIIIEIKNQEGVLISNNYSFQWSPNVSSSSTANGLTAGIYIITVMDLEGCSAVVNVQILNECNSSNFKINALGLGLNYLSVFPNPFKGSVTIQYTLAKSQNIHLGLYALSGQLIEVVHSGNQKEGIHSREFGSKHLSSGIYFIRLRTEQKILVKKIVLSE